MADGTFHFEQPVGQQFFYAQNQQSHPQRLLPGNGSPVKSGRPAFTNDTPSPSRSPGPQSPAHNFFNIYGQAHRRGQHRVMNPSNRGFNMHLNFAPKFPTQPLHHHHHHQHHPQQAQQHHGPGHHQALQQQHQQQPQADHAGPVHGVVGHQASFSSGGLTNATPHFGQGHPQNETQVKAPSATGKVSEHWQQQMQLAQESRQANSPHYFARALARDNKGLGVRATDGERGENEAERRPARKVGHVRRPDWMSLDLGGQGLRSLSESLFNYAFLDKLYMNSNKLTNLPPAIGRLKNLTHLDISNNQISELPPELGMLVNLKTLLAFDNRLQSLPHELGALYQLEIVGVEGNPLDESLKSEMMRNGTKSLITLLREQAPVPVPPSQRDWIVLDETVSSSGAQPDKFSVLTYNTLCERFATSSQFGYVPSLALSWDYRKERILQEIRSQNADVVCLQEVDMNSYHEHFRAQLAHNDYKGVFWPRTRAKTMGEREAKSVDGCATLYKHHKYILLDKQCVEFSNTAINRPDMKGEIDIYNRVMPRDNIAVVTFLENRQTGSRIVVVNAHIFWDPAYKDVKLIQAAILMEQVSKFVDGYAKWPACADKTLHTFSDDRTSNNASNNNDNQDDSPSAAPPPPPSPPPKPAPSMEYASGSQIPLVVCGDLNATSGSGVYELFAHGRLSGAHPDLAGRQYGNFTRDGMAHPFSLRSSYGNIGELSFTNYTPSFTEVIDYIWYSTNTLHVTGLLGEVDKDYLRRVPGFPNYHFPSDHLALLAEFVVKGSLVAAHKKEEEKKARLGARPELDLGGAGAGGPGAGGGGDASGGGGAGSGSGSGSSGGGGGGIGGSGIGSGEAAIGQRHAPASGQTQSTSAGGGGTGTGTGNQQAGAATGPSNPNHSKEQDPTTTTTTTTRDNLR